MGDSGCGPTALAMAMSDTGRKVTPTQMAGLAMATGDRDATGTNWNFIGKASNMMGVGTTQAIAPSAGYIANELANGNELVLSGKRGGYGFGGRGVTPYTNEGHYIVATGIDSNGNVITKDPKGGMGKYDLRSLASETGSSWSFGGRGYQWSMSTDTGSDNTYKWPNTFTNGIPNANSPANSTISGGSPIISGGATIPTDSNGKPLNPELVAQLS
jgi:hypothetical protein